MKRRTFLRSVGAATALLPIGGGALFAAGTGEKNEDDLIDIFVKRNDENISKILRSQQMKTDSPFFGGFANQHGIYNVGYAAGYAKRMLAGLISPKSAYFRSKEVETRLNLAIDFVRRMQHEDGTIDLVITNFHSPPDTAFIVVPIAQALSCIRRHAPDGYIHFQTVTKEFLTKAGQALIRGGVHTPNHRWAVCRALAQIYHLFPDNRLVKRIDEWLAEGIDIDSDGQYTEKSISIYTPMVNRCLITMARLLDRKELYDPVRKNLEMTRYFIHANGELVTETSRRQDQHRCAMAGRYYYSYRYLALLDDNASFSGMARFIEQTVGRENLYNELIYFLEDPALCVPLPPAATLPLDYERYFPGSKIVRIRRGKVDASIIAENSTVFTFHKGSAALQSLRLASAFFGKGQFHAPDVQKGEGGYVLTQRLSGSYVQPLPADLLPGDGDWSKMPKSRRERSGEQELTAKITFRESGGKFKIHFDIRGTDHVPLAIEMAFRHGGELTGVKPIDGDPDSFLIGKGDGNYRVGGDVIYFGHGPSEHKWTQIRGAKPKLDAKCVYITSFTPFDFEITIS